MHGHHERPGGRRARQRGNDLVEFTLILIPLLGYLYLTIDLGWAIFSRSTLQYAVREGVRYAVTGQTASSTTGLVDSVKRVVQSNSMGLLSGEDGLSQIQVRFYAPDTLTELASLPPPGSPLPIVEVSVEGYSFIPLLPFMRSKSPWAMTARSADRLESYPSTGPPNL